MYAMTDGWSCSSTFGELATQIKVWTETLPPRFQTTGDAEMCVNRLRCAVFVMAVGGMAISSHAFKRATPREKSPCAFLSSWRLCSRLQPISTDGSVRL